VVVEKPVTLVKTCYKVGKNPYDCGVSVQDLQSEYKALEFLSVLKQFLISHMTHDKVVLPVKSDRFDVFSCIYVKSGPSMVTGHGSVWYKIRARPKVTGHGCKAESPARFNMAFVWDKGHQQSVFAGPDGKYQVTSARRVCADGYLTASDAYHTSAHHFQAAGSSRGLPPSTGVRRMVHCTPLP